MQAGKLARGQLESVTIAAFGFQAWWNLLELGHVGQLTVPEVSKKDPRRIQEGPSVLIDGKHFQTHDFAQYDVEPTSS